MALPKTLKGFSAFLDGRGYLGRLSGGALPKLTVKTEEHRDGGMDAPIELDMGMDKMEATLTFAEYDREVFKLWGLLDGTEVPLVIRGSQEAEDGTVEAIVATLGGMVKELDAGDWKGGGEKAELKLTLAPRYYKLTIAAEDVIEIDQVNVVRMVGGVDQLQARRDALGV